MRKRAFSVVAKINTMSPSSAELGPAQPQLVFNLPRSKDEAGPSDSINLQMMIVLVHSLIC